MASRKNLSEGPQRTLTGMAQCEIVEINDLMERRMAGNLHVRNLDDDLIARLKRRAARYGRSTESEHREILRQALIADVEPSFDTLAADLRKLTKRRKQTPSEVLLREGRSPSNGWSRRTVRGRRWYSAKKPS